MWATGHLGSEKISLIGTDPVKNKKYAWKVCEQLDGQDRPRGDHVHDDAARRQSARKRLRGYTGAATQRGKLVVQQQDAHQPRDNPFEKVVVSSFLSDADLAREGARGRPVKRGHAGAARPRMRR